jgi:hypothetical protein
VWRRGPDLLTWGERSPPTKPQSPRSGNSPARWSRQSRTLRCRAYPILRRQAWSSSRSRLPIDIIHRGSITVIIGFADRPKRHCGFRPSWLTGPARSLETNPGCRADRACRGRRPRPTASSRCGNSMATAGRGSMRRIGRWSHPCWATVPLWISRTRCAPSSLGG